MKIQDFQDNVTCGGFDNIFANIYKPQDIESQKSRYMSAVEKFTALYPNRNDIHVSFDSSSPKWKERKYLHLWNRL